MIEKLTAKDILDYQRRKENLNPSTIGNFKALGTELRDRFRLTDREALDILNDRDCMGILVKHSQEVEG